MEVREIDLFNQKVVWRGVKSRSSLVLRHVVGILKLLCIRTSVWGKIYS